MVSSVTFRSSASGIRASIVEVIFQASAEWVVVVPDHSLDPSYLRASQPAVPLSYYWIKPEFRYLVATGNVYVMGFVTIAGIEEETIWPFPEHNRHGDSNL